MAILLAVLTVAAYAQVAGHEFVMYDDTLYVTANPRVQQGLTLANVRWALTATDASNWHPLTWWSHMLDVQLFGLQAGRHHLTSLALHVANTVLLLVALSQLTHAVWPSAFVAALFAVHPLHVESVAYVAERKDVLSGLFWMLALWAYARYAVTRTRSSYGVVCLCFALGLMAKPMVVTLPCVLLLLDLWPLDRLRGEKPWALIIEKVPLFAVAGAASVVTFVAQSRAGSVAPLADRPLGDRLANMVLSYVSYLGKAVWPTALACFYPYPSTFNGAAVFGAAVLLVGVSAAAVALARSRPYVATGWFWYLGTLIPVIGLVQVGEQSMADRYTYLPLIGVFLVVAWGAGDLTRQWRHQRAVLAVASGLVIAVCTGLTWREAAYWRNSRALFARALEVTTRNHVAHTNLGLLLRDEGHPDEAMAQFAAALEAYPTHAASRNHLGLTLRDLGRDDEAEASFREAIRLAPDYVAPHFNLGETLLKEGRRDQATAEFLETIRLEPDHARAQLQLGNLLRAAGRPTEAVGYARRAVMLQPQDPVTHAYLADTLATLGDLPAAEAEYRAALRLEPGGVDTHYNLGNTLARQNDFDGAVVEYRAAVALAPDYAEAHNNLGRALAAQGKIEEAVAHYSEALRLDPAMSAALLNRGRAYQQLGRAGEASADLEAARARDSRAP